MSVSSNEPTRERRFEARDVPTGFASAHVYLQLSSHSNHPAREVFFDDLQLSPPARGDAP